MLVLLALAACGGAPAPSGINDPYESSNRQIHALNLKLDANVIRPVAQKSAPILTPGVTRTVTRFSDNLSLPGVVINDILQLRIGQATHNTLRFLINTTLGVGGIFDPATKMQVPAKPTDFGETLNRWGMGEGAYVELPLVGPSTERDTFGLVVDTALDPMRLVIPANRQWVGPAAKVLSKLGERAHYSETVDSILYDSADSYAQARLLYLEHRRHELGQTTADSEFEDPYAQ